jgi:hypothetical protein
MKKSSLILLVLVAVVAVSLGTVTAASAQGLGQGDGTAAGSGYAGHGVGGYGNRGTEIEDPEVHALEVAAWSEVLGISAEDIDARLDAGETMSQIALSTGISFDEYWTLKTQIQSDVADQALAAGYITADEATLMTQAATRSGGNARGGMRGTTGTGYDGTCAGLGLDN